MISIFLPSIITALVWLPLLKCLPYPIIVFQHSFMTLCTYCIIYIMDIINNKDFHYDAITSPSFTVYATCSSFRFINNRKSTELDTYNAKILCLQISFSLIFVKPHHIDILRLIRKCFKSTICHQSMIKMNKT